ncbi:TPA: restriction endonuclease subunit S [Enterococcus faecium]
MSNDTLPEIRFPEFTDEWEQRKLGDESDVRDGTHDSPKYYDKGYPLVTSKNLKDFGLDLSNVSFISDEDFEVINKRSKVDIGDILFGMIGTIGNPVLVDRADFAIKNVALIKEQKKILNSFLIQILKSPVFDKYIKNENAGGTQKFLSLSKVRDFNFLCPNIDEQNCISAFFKKLDDTIALHQRKLDLLKETKKGFLQKMFPKNGAKVPEIRFPGFTGDWEERKLTELATTYIGLVTTMTKNYTESGTLLIRNSDIKEGKFDLNNPIYLKEDFAEQNKTRRMRNGDVVTVHTGDIGTSAVITEDLEGTIGFATITTRPSKELDSNFLSWYFNSNIHKKYARRMSTGDGRSNYNMKDFNKNVIAMPAISEQQKIGTFFKQLNDTITLHQRELDVLKETKKGFLQKMFV